MATKKKYSQLPDWLLNDQAPPSYQAPKPTPPPTPQVNKPFVPPYQKPAGTVNKYGLLGAIYNTIKGTKPEFVPKTVQPAGTENKYGLVGAGYNALTGTKPTYVPKPKEPVYAPNTEKVVNWIKSVREKGKTAQDFANEYKKAIKNPSESGLQSYATSMTLGLSDAITKNLMSNKEKEGLKLAGFKDYQEFLDAQKKAHPVTTTIGNLAGYITPWGAVEGIVGKPIIKAVSKKIVAETAAKTAAKVGAKELTEEAAKELVLKAASKKLLPRIAGTIATGGVVGAAEGAIAGEKPKDIAKRAAEYAAMGIGTEVGLAGLGKTIGGIGKVAKGAKEIKQQGIMEAFRQAELANAKREVAANVGKRIEPVAPTEIKPSGLVGDYGNLKPVVAKPMQGPKPFEAPPKPTEATNAALNTKGELKFQPTSIEYKDLSGKTVMNNGIKSGDYGVVQQKGGTFAVTRNGEIMNLAYSMDEAKNAIKKDVASQKITLPSGEQVKGRVSGEYTVVKRNKKQIDILQNGEVVTTLPSMNKVRSFLAENQKPTVSPETVPISKKTVIQPPETIPPTTQPAAEIAAQPKSLQGNIKVTPPETQPVIPKAELPGDVVPTKTESKVVNASPENPLIPNEANKFLDENYMKAVSSTRPISPQEINVDPQRFQFKRDVNAQTGAGSAISDIKQWNENLAGRITIWQDKEGKMWVVNGHHRLAAAKKLDVPYLDAKILKEIDGITANDAMVIGAKINLAEGRGTALDGAKVFRNGNYTIKDLEESGLSLKEKLIKDSYNIAQLNDNVYSGAVNGLITDNEASIIGREFPKGSKDAAPNQDAIFAYVLKNNPTLDNLKEYADMLKNADVIEGVGSTQITLEGLGMPTITNTVETKMNVISSVKKLFSREKQLFGKLVNSKNADIALKAGNLLDADANTKQKLISDMALEFIDKQKWQKGSQISDILQNASNEIVSGNLNKKAAINKAYSDIKELIDSGDFLKEKDLVKPAIESDQTSFLGGVANEKVGGIETRGSANKGGTIVEEIPKEKGTTAEAKPTEAKPTEVKRTPENSRKMFRGKNGSVDLVFPDASHADLWAFWGKMQKSIKEGTPFDTESAMKQLKSGLKLPEDTNIGVLSSDYRNYIKNSVKDLPPGETFNPISVEEFSKLPASDQKGTDYFNIPSKEKNTDFAKTTNAAYENARATPQQAQQFTESVQTDYPVVTRNTKDGTSFIDNFKKSKDEVFSFLNPTYNAPKDSLDEIMKMKGEKEQYFAKMQLYNEGTKKMFDKMDQASNFDFIDRYKKGVPQPTAELQTIADYFKEIDNATYIALQEFKPTLSFLENHFRVLWDVVPGSAKENKGLIAKIMGKRPLQGTKGMLKRHTLDSISEGIAMGGVPVSTNPYTLFELAQMDSMKYITANRMFNNLKDMGHIKYVPLGKEIPEGFTKINDSIADVYFSSDVRVKEAFDEQIFTGLNKFAESLGIKHIRKTKIKGGANTWGYTMPGGEVVTKFAGSEPILTHEIGHQLDYKYGLLEAMKNTPDAMKQLKNLADLRYEGQQATPQFQKYVRKGPELVANLVHAYVHAPNLLSEVAPVARNVLDDIISANKELQPLRNIKPSLTLGSSEDIIKGAGLIHGGRYYAESNTARLLNNYLSRDLIRSTQIGKGAMWLKNNSTAIELSVSPFHAVFETVEAVSSDFGVGLTKMINEGIIGGSPKQFTKGLTTIATSPLAPIRLSTLGGKAIKYIANPQEFITTAGGKGFIKKFPDAEQIINDLFIGGGKLAQSEDYRLKAIKSLNESMKKKQYIRALFKTIPAMNEKLMTPLFETYIPRLKIGLFFKDMSQNLSQNEAKLLSGEVTRPQLARQSWNRVENKFGEMNFDNLFWDRTFKTSMQLAFRSITWKLGTARSLGTAAMGQSEEIMKSILAAKNGKAYIPRLNPDMAWLIGVLTTTGVISSAIQTALTGQEPQSLKDFMYPRTGDKDINGNEVRLSVPTYLKDAVHLFKSPVKYFTNGSSFVLNSALNYLQNKDYFGDMIYNPDDPKTIQAMQVAKSFVPKPFAVQNLLKLNEAAVKDETKILNFLGFVQAPQEVIKSEFQNELNKAYSRQMGQKSRTPEEKATAALKTDLRSKIRTGTVTDQDVQNAVSSGLISQKNIGKFQKDASLNTMQYQWKYLSKDKKEELLKYATEEEKQMLESK